MKNGAASIANDFWRMSKQFSRLARRVRKSSNPEDLHDLRVLTRRFRAVIWLSRHSRGGPRLGRLKKMLRDLGKALGERRALDVMAKDAVRYGLRRRDLDHKLKLDMKKARGKIMTALSKRRLCELERLLSHARDRLRDRQAEDFSLAVSELIAKSVELQALRPKQAKEWHLLRIEVKKIRYASELLKVKTSELKRVQDLLGRGHDLDVLMTRFGAKRKIGSDIKKLWIRAKQAAPSALRGSEKRLLACRGTSPKIKG